MNEEDVAYQQTISVLYAVAYTLTIKMRLVKGVYNDNLLYE